ncbi:MAG: hypothetical protein COS15_02755 [Caldiserica bacterium CG02_land_8_20_14_3_00_36_38]|nr:MAG: hypothetical protein COS15_02755 [Caldiserica bacterium CG02_land_8_20_14_3_00_36_38]
MRFVRIISFWLHIQYFYPLLPRLFPVHDVLKDLKNKGITILITSPNMEELKHICDAVFWIEIGHLEKEPLQM